IHESTDEPPTVIRRVSTLSQTSEALLTVTDQNGVGGAVRTLYFTASDLGFNARPHRKSIMFTPPPEPDTMPGREGFEQFCGIKEADLTVAVGQVGSVCSIRPARNG